MRVGDIVGEAVSLVPSFACYVPILHDTAMFVLAFRTRQNMVSVQSEIDLKLDPTITGMAMDFLALYHTAILSRPTRRVKASGSAVEDGL